MTPYQSQYWAHALRLSGATGTLEQLSKTISNSRVDLNPHQVDAALFALRSPLSKGALLADEVGLGKTVEAGLVIAQRWAEKRRRILIVVPATLRKQWQLELQQKFHLPALVIEAQEYNRRAKGGADNPFEALDGQQHVLICSYQFVYAKRADVSKVAWDLIVCDEAHRLRNIHIKSNKTAKHIVKAFGDAQKLLLTATPLQNSLRELFGLVGIIDPLVLSDPQLFALPQDAAQASKLYDELRARLKSVCTRTLRKQVIQYIQFPQRRLITQEFVPTDAEQKLYDMVSAYLQKQNLVAFPPATRKLMIVVLRKLLASSTYAISGTLKKVLGRLKDKHSSVLLDDEDLEGVETLQEEAAEVVDADSFDTVSKAEDPEFVDPEQVKAEFAELADSVALAEGISENAKGEQLVPALERAFQQAAPLGAPRKAVIFTESRRTQQYLFDLLKRKGYEGQIVALNGTNDDASSKAIYAKWLARHAGQDVVTGVKPVDMKAALTEEFRERATLLLATEAAAEGLNLQFCALVVNFDLPWNPQRIEQRIGRCHRYGQKHDVVVVNFLNKSNEADQRVYELLSQKFKLFEGVFGASDEILGALGSGVDVESRIVEVYQTCRNAEEIKAAFDKLQAELDGEIQAEMLKTRKALIDHFDEEVAAKLKVRDDETRTALSRRERWLWSMTAAELGSAVTQDASDPSRFQYSGSDAPNGTYHLRWDAASQAGDAFYYPDHALAKTVAERAMGRSLPPAHLRFEYDRYGSQIAALKKFVSQSGWLELSKLTVTSTETQEFLIFAACTDAGESLAPDDAAKMLDIPATVVEQPISMPTSVDLASLRQQDISRWLAHVEKQHAKFYDEEDAKLETWAEDQKRSLDLALTGLATEIKQLKAQKKQLATLHEKVALDKEIKAKEKEHATRKKAYFDTCDEVDKKRDEFIATVQSKLNFFHSVECKFSIRWSLTV